MWENSVCVCVCDVTGWLSLMWVSRTERNGLGKRIDLSRKGGGKGEKTVPNQQRTLDKLPTELRRKKFLSLSTD